MTPALQFQPSRKLLYVRSATTLIVALFPAILVTIPLVIIDKRPGMIAVIALIVFVTVALLRIAYLNAHFPTIRYELTERTLSNAEGVFWKVRRTTPLEKVTNVDVRQGPLERWLGIGNVWVFTPSTGALLPEAMLVGLDNAFGVRERILALAEAARAAPSIEPASLAARSEAATFLDERTLGEMLRTLQRMEGLLRDLRDDARKSPSR